MDGDWTGSAGPTSYYANNTPGAFLIRYALWKGLNRFINVEEKTLQKVTPCEWTQYLMRSVDSSGALSGFSTISVSAWFPIWQQESGLRVSGDPAPPAPPASPAPDSMPPGPNTTSRVPYLMREVSMLSAEQARPSPWTGWSGADRSHTESAGGCLNVKWLPPVWGEVTDREKRHDKEMSAANVVVNITDTFYWSHKKYSAFQELSRSSRPPEPNNNIRENHSE